jgi:hypothetical protein
MNEDQINQTGLIGGAIGGIIGLLVAIILIASIWKIFTKAGQPGWAAIIPIYNIIVLLQITGKPLWWIILMLIPFINIVIALVLMLALAQRFGKGAGFGLGLFFLGIIFFPILGFGDARYQGPALPSS